MADKADRKKRAEQRYQKSYFDVLGICCPSEVPLIESILKSLDGVKDFSIIVPSRTVIVVHDTLLLSQPQIVKALNEARLEANVRLYGETSFKKKWPSPFTVVSGLLLALSFLKYAYHPLRWLAIGAVAAGIYPIATKAFASVRRFRLDINILALIAVIGTIAMNDYTEAATVVFLFSVAEWLETRASHKASAVMLSLMSLAPQKAVVAETGEEVDVDEVKVNTVLAVKAGETIPIDGIVVDGSCEVDEKTLTGEAFPVPKQRDSTVWAGTMNINGYISVRTVALAEDCVVVKMSKLVEDAQNSKTRTQKFIDKFSLYYTPVVVIVSAGFAVVPAALRLPNLKHWFHLALVVLVSACPCGLILSTPVATFCALTKAATQGLLIKGGDYLELLSKTKAIAFDKTGTITRGEFLVRDFQSLTEDISLHTLLYWVSSIERKSSHPMAAALVDHAKSSSIEPKPDAVEDYQSFPGEGICGKIDGRDVYIGNKKIALRAGCSTVPNPEGLAEEGKTVGYIYCGANLTGIFSLSDACRSGVAQGIKELKSLGIKVAMLTGDNQAAATQAQEELANELEIIHAELLPEDKARIINEFKRKIGPTAMVGDGMNDAPALATADVGISMGISGSALATETGHVILMSNDVRKIPKALKLARKTQRKVRENVILSISIKGGILGLGFAGHPLVWAAVLADVGSCLLVILNSMLLLRERNKPASKCYRASSTLSKLESGCSGDTIRRSQPCQIDSSRDRCCESKASGNRDCCTSASLEVNNIRSCNSGWCSDKNQKMIRSSETPACDSQDIDLGDREEMEASTRSCKTGCCGDKPQQQKADVVNCSCDSQGDSQETGLPMKNNRSCNLGYCRDKSKELKEKENTMDKSWDPKYADLRIGRAVKKSGSCNTGCCNKKEVQDIMPQSYLLPIKVEKRNSGSCNSGCCSDKSKQLEEESTMVATWFVDLEKGPSANSNASCKASCCSEKEPREAEKITPQSSCLQLVDLEKGLSLKNCGSCKSSCCSNKKLQETCKIRPQSIGSQPVDVEKGQSSKSIGSCNSGCCSDKSKQPKDTIVSENSAGRAAYLEKAENYKLACCQKSQQSRCNNKSLQDKDDTASQGFKPRCASSEKNSGSCNSACCGKKNQHEIDGITPQSGGSSQNLDQEKSLPVQKSGSCISGCCIDESKQPMENTVTESFSESDINLEKAKQCKSSCYRETQVANETQVCTKQPMESKTGMAMEKNGNCKSSCCTVAHCAKEKDESKGCCMIPWDSEPALRMKSVDHWSASCCKQTSIETENHACLSMNSCVAECSGPSPGSSLVVVQSSTSQERKGEGVCCLSYEKECCRNLERKSHVGCCRSYARECCSRRRGGRAGFGSLTEIVIE